MGVRHDDRGSRPQRWQAILELLADRDRLTVAEASHALRISAATIRRDFAGMADQQLVTRIHGGVVATTLALTYLNPHVYLDTVVMLGNLANQYGADRWLFSGGAAFGSLAWFTGLGFGARALAVPLGRPSVWRVIDIVIGVIMVAIAIRLATLS